MGQPLIIKVLQRYKEKKPPNNDINNTSNVTNVTNQQNDEEEKVETYEDFIDYKMKLRIVNQIQPEPNISKFQITLMQYNVLADCLCTPSYFSYCKPDYLQFNYRSQRIADQIKELNPDIITLQEVDKFKKFYEPELSKLKYNIAENTFLSDHGLLIAYKQDMFIEIEKHLISYDKLTYEGLIPKLSLKTKKLYNLYSHKFIILVLKHRKSGQIVVVATTHIYYDPRMEHVKQYQISALLDFINRQFYGVQTNIILTGDFNSTPQSNQIQFLLNKLPPQKNRTEQQYLPYINYYDQEQFYDFFIEKMKFNFYSAYLGYRCNRGKLQHPKYTNYTQRFKGTLDYIFYTEPLQVGKIMEIPNMQIVAQEGGGIPSSMFPSDHVPLFVEFNLSVKNPQSLEDEFKNKLNINIVQ